MDMMGVENMMSLLESVGIKLDYDINEYIDLIPSVFTTRGFLMKLLQGSNDWPIIELDQDDKIIFDESLHRKMIMVLEYAYKTYKALIIDDINRRKND